MPGHGNPGIAPCGVSLLHQVAGFLDLTFQIGVRVRQDLQDIRPSTTIIDAAIVPGHVVRQNHSVRVLNFVCGHTAQREAAGVSVDHDARWHKDTHLNRHNHGVVADFGISFAGPAWRGHHDPDCFRRLLIIRELPDVNAVPAIMQRGVQP